MGEMDAGSWNSEGALRVQEHPCWGIVWKELGKAVRLEVDSTLQWWEEVRQPLSHGGLGQF